MPYSFKNKYNKSKIKPKKGNFNGHFYINKFNNKRVLKSKLLTLIKFFTFLYTCRYYYIYLNWFRKFFYKIISLKLIKWFKYIKAFKSLHYIMNKNTIDFSLYNINLYKWYIWFMNKIQSVYFKPVLLKDCIFSIKKNKYIKKKSINYIIKKNIYIFFNYIIYRFFLFLLVYWSNFLLKNIISILNNKYNIIYFSKLLLKPLSKLRFIRNFKLDKFYLLYKTLNYTIFI